MPQKPQRRLHEIVQEGCSRSLISRKPNADGTITVVCRICGNPITRIVTRGYSTATCIRCQGIEIPEPEVPGFQGLYGSDPDYEKVGLARRVFRALGFGRAKPPKPPQKESIKVSKEKRRKPLFDPEEEHDVSE